MGSSPAEPSVGGPGQRPGLVHHKHRDEDEQPNAGDGEVRRGVYAHIGGSIPPP
jgi:hypothetical protein